MRSSDRLARRRATLLAITAVLCGVALLTLYVLFVRTRWGQHLDDIAYQGRDASATRAGRRSERLLRSVTESSLALLTLAFMLISLARRRWRLAAAVVVAIGGAILTTEVLKHIVFVRPVYPGIGGFDVNSYPSGHATIGTSLGLALVMVAPQRWRWLAGIAGALVTAVFGFAVLVTGWHRPSDVLGAYSVALGWFAAVTAVLLAWRGSGRHDMAARIEDRATPGVEAVAGLLVLGSLVAVFVAGLDVGQASGVSLRFAYVAAVGAIDALGILTVAWYFGAIKDCSLDAPPPPRLAG